MATSSGLADLIRPGMRVLLGDGLGTPRIVAAELSELAEGVELVLGWLPETIPELELNRFEDVRALMSGWGLRRAIDTGSAHAVVTRLSAIPALLAGPLRPDLVILAVAPAGNGFALSTESTWVRSLLDANVPVAAVLSDGPVGERYEPIPADRVTVVGEGASPATLGFAAPTDAHRALAVNVATLIPEGARLHIGPGAFGTAVLDALDVPVSLDTGLLGDGVLDLERRGLLLGDPITTYLAGSSELLDWADGRGALRRIEFTHDLTRLSRGAPFFALNTALELDLQGQVNVEGTSASSLGGIGGHPDYAAAGTMSMGGASVIAVLSGHGGSATLVEKLSRPVTTPSHDVGVVVTERGVADLRGLDRRERERRLRRLWG